MHCGSRTLCELAVFCPSNQHLTSHCTTYARDCLCACEIWKTEFKYEGRPRFSILSRCRSSILLFFSRVLPQLSQYTCFFLMERSGKAPAFLSTLSRDTTYALPLSGYSKGWLLFMSAAASCSSRSQWWMTVWYYSRNIATKWFE